MRALVVSVLVANLLLAHGASKFDSSIFKGTAGRQVHGLSLVEYSLAPKERPETLAGLLRRSSDAKALALSVSINQEALDLLCGLFNICHGHA